MAALALPALALSSLAYLDARTDLSRDLRLIAAIVKARIALKRSLSNDKCSIWYEFEQAYESRGDAECYQCEGVSLSWKQVFEGAFLGFPLISFPPSISLVRHGGMTSYFVAAPYGVTLRLPHVHSTSTGTVELIFSPLRCLDHLTESNRIARYFLALGLKRGDTIALFMPNKLAYVVGFLSPCLAVLPPPNRRVDYSATTTVSQSSLSPASPSTCASTLPLLSLSSHLISADVNSSAFSLRSIPALINYNLVSTALSHCISIASPKLILYDSSISSPIADVAGELGVKMPDLAFVRWRDEWDSAVKGEKGEEAGAKVEGETELTPVVRRQYSGDKLPDSHRKGVSWTRPVSPSSLSKTICTRLTLSVVFPLAQSHLSDLHLWVRLSFLCPPPAFFFNK